MTDVKQLFFGFFPDTFVVVDTEETPVACTRFTRNSRLFLSFLLLCCNPALKLGKSEGTFVSFFLLFFGQFWYKMAGNLHGRDPCCL